LIIITTICTIISNSWWCSSCWTRWTWRNTSWCNI